MFYIEGFGDVWFPKVAVEGELIQRWVIERKGLSKLIVEKPDSEKCWMHIRLGETLFCALREYSEEELHHPEFMVTEPFSEKTYVVTPNRCSGAEKEMKS
ncbi:MAG: hypothetical protein ACFFER_12000 [Candidatus Thorarchaeota archaeon]